MKLVTAEYVEKNKIPYIVLFTRNGNQREKTVVSGFRPYFYVQCPEGESGSFKTIDGFAVKKVYTETPEDVLQAREMYPKTWESDVRFVSRYLIDAIPSIEKCDLRVQYVDVETSPQTGEIISIATYDNYLKKCICLVWREDLEYKQYDKEYGFPSGFSFKATVHLYNSRKVMLSDYIRFVKESDPDILSGWFSTAFDFKVIIQQINACGLNAGDLSPLGKAYMIGDKVSKLESNIKIAGRVLWDMLRAYRALQPSRLPDASLEAISQLELKEGKHKHIPFSELWKDIDNLVEYNAKDAVLVYRIDQKNHLLEYFNTLRCFIGCEWSSLWYETLLWDTYILRKLHNTLVLPSKIKKKGKHFEGAKVLQPVSKGIHRNIILIDLKSLYPSVIVTFNMSPETLVKDSNYDNCYKLPNGVAFRKDKIGIIPEVLLELMKLRIEYKTEMNKYPYYTNEYEYLNQQQISIKVLLNALYGALAYENFRLVTPPIASSITFAGRNILEFIVKQVESLGFKVLYGDTDSIFIYANSEDPKECVRQMLGICEHLNISLIKFVKDFGGSDNCTIKIEPKKIYKSFMMSQKKSGDEKTAKKRYAGLVHWTDDFIDINSDKALEVMGYESKRSDSSALSRDVQKKVIRMLLEGKSESDLKLYIEQMTLYLRNGECDYEYVGIPKGLSMNLGSYKTDNPHRRAALYSNKYLGTKYDIADMPKIIYVCATGKYPKTDVIAFNASHEIPSDFIMDVNIMIDKTIIKKVEHILGSANIDVNELLHPHRKLDEF